MTDTSLQISFLGFSNPMGAPYIDDLVAERAAISAEARQPYAETIH